MQKITGIPKIEKILIRKVVHDLTEIVKCPNSTFKFFGIKANKKWSTPEDERKQKNIYTGLCKLNANLQWLAYKNPRQFISEIKEIDFKKNKIFMLDSFNDYSTIVVLIEAQLEYQRRNYCKDDTMICEKLLSNNGHRWIIGKTESVLRFIEEASNIDYKEYTKKLLFYVSNYEVFISDNAVLLESKYLDEFSSKKNEVLIASF